jgi:hypothetical protein
LRPISPTVKKRAIVDALVDAAVAGARVAYSQLAAYAVEQGFELPDSLTVEGLRAQNLWPYGD